MAPKPKPVKLDGPIRKRIYDSIAEVVGNTPLVRLHRVAEEAGAVAQVLVKLEYLNPLLSVKDRIGLSMIEALEAHERLIAGETLATAVTGEVDLDLPEDGPSITVVADA